MTAFPGWFDPLLGVIGAARRGGGLLGDPRFAPPPGHHRHSAVLMLFAGPGAAPDGPDGASSGAPAGVDVLLTERSPRLRSHAGQVSFPGGRLDPEDGDPDGEGPDRAALREAREETGLDPAGVVLAGRLPAVYLSPSDYAVSPVLGWWRAPSPVHVVDPAEVARVERVPVAELVDPANRFLVSHPSGFVGPGFGVRSLFVWGFTAILLDRVLARAGWERPWDASRVLPVPPRPEPDEVDAIEAGG